VFGDGEPIPFASVATIRNTIRDETTTFDWQKGDVLLIDNILVSHGRKAFEGPRRILAALIDDAAGPPIDRPSGTPW
jgi:alpha-ketoglutarate-dependent taurine dioxygenase